MKKIKLLAIGIFVLLIGTVIFHPITGMKIEDAINNEEKILKNNRDTDWWPMFRCDAQNTGCSPSSAPVTNQISWTYETEQYIEGGSTVVANNKLFIGTTGLYGLTTDFQLNKPFQIPRLDEPGTMYCFNAISGVEQWSEDLGYIPNAPAVYEDQVIFNSLDFETGDNKLYSFDVETGGEQWSIPLDTWSWSPIIHDDKIYVAHFDNDYIFSYVDCIYASNGAIAWSYDSPSFTYIFCSPAVYEEKIYFVETFDNNKVVCLNAGTGEFIWDEYLDIIESYSLVVTDGKVIVAGLDESGENGIVYCISSETGSYIWDYPMGPHYIQYPTYPGIAVSTNEIIVTSTGSTTSYVHCINPSSGYPAWIKPFSNAIFGSPSIADGKVYFSTLPGYMYCLDVTDGEQIWTEYIGYGTVSSPAIANGYVYMAQLMGTIISFGEPTFPDTPTIDGETSGKVGEIYEYIISSTDPQDEDLFYFIDWGDDTYEEWIGPYDSGEEVVVSHSWDEENTYTIRAKAKDINDAESDWGTFDVTIVTGTDLSCTGSLSWSDVKPEETVTDSFTVENIGEPDSLLDWEIDEYPDWGDWTFTPSSGDDLLPNTPVTIGVTVIAPDEPEETFTGEVKIANSEDPDDTCIIDVSLATPVNQQVTNPLLQMILERFPNAFPILRHLLGL